ncbi:MAG: hypothetical protein FJ255_10165 [Phycisphaerae bacterium]|nr:hypothetical protein [Phycisphaerae bacterium]
MARGRDIDEDPSPEDVQKFGGETVRCPACGAEVYDQAEWCHKCGAVLSESAGRTPRWVWVTGLAVIAALVVFGLRLF